MKFAIYDFEITVPKEWKIAIDKKSSYVSGMVGFTTVKGTAADLIWENLDRYMSKHTSVEAFLENYFEGMKNNRNIKTIEINKGLTKTTNEHTFLPHEFRYDYKQPLSRGFSQKVIGVAMYDLHSNRFAIVFSRWDPNKENPDEPSIREALGTFDCLCNKGTNL